MTYKYNPSYKILTKNKNITIYVTYVKEYHRKDSFNYNIEIWIFDNT